MATQPAPTAPNATPAPSAVPIVESGPADNASLAAELEAMTGGGDEPLVEEAPAEPAKEAPAEDEPASEAPAEDDADEGDDKPIPDETEEPATDPAMAKRLEAVQRAEKRAKELVAKEREAFERERSEWQAKVKPHQEAVEKFEALAKRAKYDPVGVLLHLGIVEDDFEQVARTVYDHSKAAAGDPKRKEYAQRSMREREAADKLEQVAREFAEFKQQTLAEKQQAAEQQRIGSYLESVAKAASDETPIVRNLLTKNPDVARARLRQTAQYLYEKTGEDPDPGEVLKALETVEREDFEARGGDYAALVKAPKAVPPAPGKKPGKTLSSDLGSATKAKPAAAPPKSKREERDDIVRELERLGSDA